MDNTNNINPALCLKRTSTSTRTKTARAMNPNQSKADTPREAPQPVAATVRRIKINMMP